MLSRKVISSQRAPVLPIIVLLVTLYAAEGQQTTKGEEANEGHREKKLVCPPPNQRPDSAETVLLNLLQCSTRQDCPLHKDLGILCCKAADGKNKRCRYGVIPPKPKPTHLPFLGIERHCPEKDPLAEILTIKNCTSDNDCWPRICCDGYCRTPDLPKIIPSESGYSSLTTLKDVAAYLQCTPPPRYDFFRKTCLSMRDCFPMICCQERDVKVCRPAKKSILPILASLLKDAVEE